MKKSIGILWFFLAILSCSKEEDVIVTEKGKITSFVFSEHDNYMTLLSDVACSVDGNVIQGRIPHYLKDKKLIPTVTFLGSGMIVLRGQENSGTRQPTDFTREVVYDIVNETTGEIENSYVVHITSYTGLPVINVYTEDNTEIDSKDVYKDATICCDFNNPDHPEYSFENAKVNIRGRGNSTWELMPKKPYKLKFDKKTRLFGESEGKQWVLLANYADKSALRNAIAFKLSELSDLAWTPCSHFVELFINDKYRGNYQLTEQIKIAKDRINLPEGGMILEIDHPTRIAADDVCFTTDKLLFVIKDPDVSVGSDDYNWVKDRLNSIEHILFSDSWLAERGGIKITLISRVSQTGIW